MKLPFSTNTIVYNGEVTDSDAAAFIAAAGITNQTQKTAINILVLNLKAASLWTKMSAIYPFVGGTANTHKYNLKDPRDLDAAFRLTFNGGWTHSSTGALPNGVDGWANTYLKPNPVLPSTNAHMSFYSRTNIQSGNTVDIGETPTSFTFYLSAHYSSGAGTPITNLYNSGYLGSTASVPNTFGLFTSSRTGNTAWSVYRNSTVIVNRTNTIDLYPTGNVVFGRNQLSEYSAREFAFASLGQGLNDSEMVTLYTAVQAFQTRLGRQV